MPFDKVGTRIDFPAQERAILEFWQRTQAFEQLRARNRGKPKWSFLDGPITANNPMGVHHAWGRTYKDAYQRYHAMTGRELRYQNGFDCQGLWVEVEVEKELKLRSKQDIENLVPGDKFKSIDKFVRDCKQRVDKFAKTQTEQSIRLGYWMNWDRDEDWRKPPDQRRSYFTMSEENNYTIWSFLKKCHQRGLIYKAYDSMPWCPRCAVGISQMEMHEGYQLVAHRAVFVRFPLRRSSPSPLAGEGRGEGAAENLLVWTTTPWTLSSNVAAAVNPELTYVRVKHQDQIYYLAKGALTANRLEEDFKKGNWVEGVPKLKPLAQIFKEKGGFEVLGELQGREMLGWTYEGPFDEVPAQVHAFGYPAQIAKVVQDQKWSAAVSGKAAHRVIAWDAVGETEGTGIVHIAPGCGKEDFELGKVEGLPPIAPLDEEGIFLPGFGPLEGKSAYDHETTDLILDNLKDKGLLLAVERYPHNYPHCWRCKTELLFRLVDEWYINMSWRDEIMRVVEDVTFLPESINGKARELDWLRNMGDWMISKKRYWGLALPIWVDEQTGEFEVIGSREELKARAVEGWDQFGKHSPHRPWIDLVKIRNPKTGNLMSRIPDVGNPWLDAGIVPYSTMGYNRNRAYWEQWFPADFITESFPGQFRNWFYAILAMSTMMEWERKPRPRAPMKVLLGHAQVRDQYGEEMHKTAGNAIDFNGAADTGYTIDHELKPGEQPRPPESALSFEIVEKENKGHKTRVLRASYPPMSADLIRWVYCRHNPAQNINFGPGPAEELRSKFTLKLWNVYAFFCNYARLDGFDPNAAQVPIHQRPDIDRWILSDLQLLIRTARREFERYNIQAFCVQAEQFVDDRLSNWYVRRNRRRFWKSEKGDDKLAAYQTLYTVLTTLTKLFAPIMPFLAEAMYQNLVVGGQGSGVRGQESGVRGQGSRVESVHHCEFPEVDESLVDADLSADMETLLWVVSLGMAARNTVKRKVRQPLREMRVETNDLQVPQVLERFADVIREELNIKEITLHDPGQGHLLGERISLDIPALGKKFGSKLNDIRAAFEAADQGALAQKRQERELVYLDCPWGKEPITPAQLLLELVAPEGWGWAVDTGIIIIVDGRVTPDLAAEGMAREIVRHVQNLRKEAGLEPEDRIVLYLGTDSATLRAAIEAHRDYIAAETLTAKWSEVPLGDGAARGDVNVEGQPLRIELRKV